MHVDKLIKVIAEKCPVTFDIMLEKMAASDNMEVDQYISDVRSEKSRKRQVSVSVSVNISVSVSVNVARL